MDRDHRQALHAIADQVAQWVDRARDLHGRRDLIERAAADAVESVRRRAIGLTIAGSPAWRVIPLRTDDDRTLGSIARQAHLPPLSATDRMTLHELLTGPAAAVRDVKSVVGTRRFFSGQKKKAVGASAGQFLTGYRARALHFGVPQLLDRLSVPLNDSPTSLPVRDALAEWVGLRPRIADLGHDPRIEPVSVLGQLKESIDTIDAALRRERLLREEAVAAGNAARLRHVRTLLANMPVSRLKDATRDRIRVGPLTDAGIETVQDILDRGAGLERLPGIGPTSASRILGAALTLSRTAQEETPVHIDIHAPTAEATELLRRLAAWDAVRRIGRATTELAYVAALTPVVDAIDSKVTHIVVLAAGRTATQFHEAIRAVNSLAARIPDSRSVAVAGDPWQDFRSRPADYFALLSELGLATGDEEESHGDLPDDIVEAVRAVALDTRYLTASLRGYQSFAARFALVQRKVLIGDEMGLGKTVEALAVLAHLRAKGLERALVICPASVVTNWVREIRSKSSLRPHRVHGPGRESALAEWVRTGGVAVTTYETLGWMNTQPDQPADIGCVVVDEAHYIKNPAANRSKRVARIIRGLDRAILLTGTPLENRVDEFRNLVRYLRPDLVVNNDALTPLHFRRQVAPAYLRRNQQDVLVELPELVEVDEWLPMSAADDRRYRDAVRSGNFMAMRQAAMLSPESEKIQRLIEIVTEAEDNGRRVIVFSYFRKVLDQVVAALPGKVFGPLTGSVSANQRQEIVDQFSAADSGAALVSQIIAGGVGLNIQAASVVVICEPQLKPTTEWQAIGRARRMGQLHSVQVHRLLSEDAVDQRITEILARKKTLFDQFARVSDTAGSTPEAVDISEADLEREVVAAEWERLFGGIDADRPGRPDGP